jgi:heme exporter protein C
MTGNLHRFANPARFQRLARRVIPWGAATAAAMLAIGLYLALFASPPDYQQGETVRIMYVHVPAAWMALGAYTTMALASATALIWKHRLGDLIAQSAAPIGAGFTVIALATGMLWGQPMWGTFWAWDARLTSVLILLFLYLGYMALVRAFDDPERGARAGAILALVGWINVPIVKFSVDWWNTLHQPASISRLAKPAIHSSILTPLLVMAVAFMLVFATLLLIRVRSAIAEHRLRTLAMARAQG